MLTDEDRVLLEFLGLGEGLVPKSNADRERLDRLVEMGFGCVEQRLPLLNDDPAPLPIYRITPSGQWALRGGP